MSYWWNRLNGLGWVGQVGSLGALVTLLVGAGCSGGSPATDGDTIRRYHQALETHQAATTTPDDSLDVYMDVSRDMDAGLAEFHYYIRDLLVFLNGQKTAYYQVGSVAQPIRRDRAWQESLTASSSAFTDDKSILDVALDRILAHPNRQAIFITDFLQAKDLVPKPIRNCGKSVLDGSDWGQKYFNQWVEQGGRVDVAAWKSMGGQDDKKRLKRNLYVLVFTPPTVQEEQSVRHKLTTLGQLTADAARYVVPIAAQPSRTKTTYPKQSGDHEHGLVETLAPSDFSPQPEHGFDYYDIPLSELSGWQGEDENGRTDRRILRRLFLEKLPFPTAGAPQLSVKVFNQTQDFERFQDFLAENNTGESTEPRLDPETGAPIPQTGKPRKTFKARRGAPAPAFLQAVYNTKTDEIGLKLPEPYTGIEPGFYRVEVYVQAEPAWQVLQPYMSFPEPNNGCINEAMFLSVKGAWEQARTQSRPVYIYYLNLTL